MSFVISEEKNQMKTEPQGLKRNGAEKERVSAMKLGIGLYRHNYERKLLEQNAKLQALEMQINPHFLYNTLEAVYCCSKMKRMEDACKIVVYTGFLKLVCILVAVRKAICRKHQHIRQSVGFISASNGRYNFFP